MADGVMSLASSDDLVRFLAHDPQADRAAEFHDTLVEIYEPVPVDDEPEVRDGWYARIWLRPPLGLDLLVQPREQREPECELEARFEITAANRGYALRRLAAIAPILVTLGDRYDLELRDDRLELGPLTHPPREVAEDLTLLIDALATLQRSDDEPEPEQASFCHFCGHGVAEDTASCPRCGERLLDG